MQYIYFIELCKLGGGEVSIVNGAHGIPGGLGDLRGSSPYIELCEALSKALLSHAQGLIELRRYILVIIKYITSIGVLH